MARRFDLGMSMGYVREWGVVEGIRELYQNALDAQTENPENELYHSYDKETETFMVGNKSGMLTTNTILLGHTTKAENDKLIGSHGEGYKVATVVLLREGCSVTVYNYKAREIWRAKIVNSRRYGEPVAVFDIEKVAKWHKVPSHDLIFEVKGISEEMYQKVVESNLHLQDNINKKDGKYGSVLLDEDKKGKLYVSGLYICTKEQCKWGYDFKPDVVKLDRDRGLVDSFELQWALGKVLLSIEDTDFIYDAKDAWDGYYIRSAIMSTGTQLQDVYERAYEAFVAKNGYVEPVTETAMYEAARKKGIKVALVSENEAFYIKRSSRYIESADISETSSEDYIKNFKAWFDGIKGQLTEEQLKEGAELIENLELYID